MTTTQRRTLATGAGLAILLLVVVLLLSRGGSDGPDRLAVRGRAENAPTTEAIAAPEPTPPSDAAGGTTIPLIPLTTGVPVPNAIEAPPPTTAPTATPGAPRAGAAAPTTSSGGQPAAAGTSAVVATGAVLVKPPDSTATRPVDKAAGCNSANDPGWKIEECGALRSGGSVLLWLVESKEKGTRTLVLREQTAGRWAVVLGAHDDSGKALVSVGVRGEDVSGDGQPELVFGFHRRGDDKVLSMDVVDSAATVVVHRDLVRGSVRVAKAQLDTWAANGSAFDHVVIRFTGGQWRASAPQPVASGDVPSSMV